MIETTFIGRHGYVRHWGSNRTPPYPRIERCEVLGCGIGDKFFGLIDDNEIISRESQRIDPYGIGSYFNIPGIGYDELVAEVKLLAGIHKRRSERRRATQHVFDHCHNHGWVRGIICYGCNSTMRRVDKGIEYRNTRRVRFNGQTLEMTMPETCYAAYWSNCPDCASTGPWEVLHPIWTDNIDEKQLPQLISTRMR